MLDLNYIRANPQQVVQNCVNRGVTVDIATLVLLDGQRRQLDLEIQELRAQGKKLAAEKTPQAIDEGRGLRIRIAGMEADLAVLTEKVAALHLAVPNLTHPDTPIGRDETYSREIAFGKTPIAKLGFVAKDHLDLATALGIVDMAAGTKVVGNGFYFLRNEGALLELALQNFVIRKLMGKGYQFNITPDVARHEIMAGTGYVPRGNETNTYTLENTQLSLIATAEIPLCGQYANQVIDVRQPIRLCGLSHCFRTERAAGKATRGLYRVHQFAKVEMVVLCAPEQSEALHEEILEIEKEIFDELAIPYRVIDIATGDMGASAYKKYDLEAWMPGRNGGVYGEVTSASNCTDYQARRMNIRYKTPQGDKAYVHTLNGTGIAISRALVALLETHQTASGEVIFPPTVAQLLGIAGVFKPV